MFNRKLINHAAYQIISLDRENSEKEIFINPYNYSYTSNNKVKIEDDKLKIIILIDIDCTNIGYAGVLFADALSDCIGVRNKIYKNLFKILELSTNYERYKISKYVRNAFVFNYNTEYAEFHIILDECKVKNDSTHLDKKNILEVMYFNQSKSITDMSKELNMSVSAVRHIVSDMYMRKQKSES